MQMIIPSHKYEKNVHCTSEHILTSFNASRDEECLSMSTERERKMEKMSYRQLDGIK